MNPTRILTDGQSGSAEARDPAFGSAKRFHPNDRRLRDLDPKKRPGSAEAPARAHARARTREETRASALPNVPNSAPDWALGWKRAAKIARFQALPALPHRKEDER
jgi:hypothetical protein